MLKQTKCLVAMVMMGWLVFPGLAAEQEREPDEPERQQSALRARADSLMREAEELLERGQAEAARVKRAAIRALAKKMLQEAQELVRRRQMEAAEQLKRAAAEVYDQVQQLELSSARQRELGGAIADRLHELRDRLGDALREGRKELASDLRRQIEEIQRDLALRKPAGRAAERRERSARDGEHPGHRPPERDVEHRARRHPERDVEHRARRELEREHAERRERPHPEWGGLGPREREELDRRAHHLRVAAENLAAIEMHELAERLTREAIEIERRLRGPELPGMPPELFEHIHRHFDELHRRVDELNERLDRVTETVERRERRR